LRPGNAGGGKDPDFWCAFEDGEVKVIGKCLQTPKTTGSIRESCIVRRRKNHAAQMTLAVIRVHGRPPARGGAGGDDGIRASLLPRGGETVCDDVAAAGDLPVPVAGCAVRGNVVRKYGILGSGYGILGLGFE
jgi:hypothetical protein